jgi:hypothetical protein
MFWSDEELQELQGTAVVGLLSNFHISRRILVYKSGHTWLTVVIPRQDRSG